MPRRGERRRRAARSSAEGACTITPTSGSLVVTWTSGCTCSTFAATAVTSSVDIIHAPSAEQQRQLRRRASPGAAASAGSGAPAAAPEHQVDRVAVLAPRRSRRGLVGRRVGRGEAGLHVLAQLVGVVRQRSRSSAAIARVFTRAWPTGSP